MNSKVLIVEDDEWIRDCIRELLEEEGLQVVVATNGRDAIELLHAMSELPQLILLDLMMPVMDGNAFRDTQAVDVRLAEIPVVVMTADGQIEAKQAKLGAREYLKKPVKIDTLIDTVSRYCPRTVGGPATNKDTEKCRRGRSSSRRKRPSDAGSGRSPACSSTNLHVKAALRGWISARRASRALARHL